MSTVFDLLVALLAMTTLVLLGTSRLTLCIRTVAVQGVALGLLSLLLQSAEDRLAVGVLACLSVVLKGLVFPWLLFRAVRVAQVRREVEPFVSCPLSLAIGIVMLAAGYGLAARLPLLLPPGASPHVVPLALFTMGSGLFLIISRRKALTQVVGYLALENGIYAFGIVALHGWAPFLVELGILLDVFVAVFVMGITIFHISREFDHIDADQLAALRDWTSTP